MANNSSLLSFEEEIAKLPNSPKAGKFNCEPFKHIRSEEALQESRELFQFLKRFNTENKNFSNKLEQI